MVWTLTFAPIIAATYLEAEVWCGVAGVCVCCVVLWASGVALMTNMFFFLLQVRGWARSIAGLAPQVWMAVTVPPTVCLSVLQLSVCHCSCDTLRYQPSVSVTFFSHADEERKKDRDNNGFSIPLRHAVDELHLNAD